MKHTSKIKRYRDTFFFIPHTHWEGAVFKTREEYLEMGLPNILRALKLLKQYPAYRLARVEGDKGADGMFMVLFNHIKRNKIEMTAPVEMAWPDEAAGQPAAKPAAMAFLYGEPDWGEQGADPADGRVVVEDIPPMQVVSIAMRGAYDRKHFAEGHERLEAWLAEHPEWEPAGVPRTFNYNSPFVPNLVKVAEVQIPIRPRPTPAEPSR